MIHGWPDSAQLWRHQVPHLVSHGYRVPFGQTDRGGGVQTAERGRRHDEEIPDASHWVPLDAPGRLNELLLEWLG
jgi:pimeloyl-ACP methyl ester carboxylesterase